MFRVCFEARINDEIGAGNLDGCSNDAHSWVDLEVVLKGYDVRKGLGSEDCCGG